MFRLTKNGYDAKNIVSYGNMFLLGNGHLGYRGTLEEYEKGESVALNIVGVYDKYADKWRESLNAPNPFFVSVSFGHIPLDIRKLAPISHRQALDLRHGIFSRETHYEQAIIRSWRFIDKKEINNLAMRYEVESCQDGELVILAGIDYDVWDINGPHLSDARIGEGKPLSYLGHTNEGKYLAVASDIQVHFKTEPSLVSLPGKTLKKFVISAQKGHRYAITVFADIRVGDNPQVFGEAIQGLSVYEGAHLRKRLRNHKAEWEKQWSVADVHLEGPKPAAFALRYSIYHLLALAPTANITSIPARGLSGQTYKGAIFWDTEIFMMPFFHLTNPEIGRKLVIYRINTLEGAKRKAKFFGYDGAFYAWESQDTGDEACSLYQVSDAITGKPIRTYFADKQIHISGDVALGIVNTYERTHSLSLLTNGGLTVLLEVAKFYQSYATYDPRQKVYFLNDVIGPDEYHERIDNNAFTNYLAYQSVDNAIKYAEMIKNSDPEIYRRVLQTVGLPNLDGLAYFRDRIFLPKPNKDGIIEQFTGYFRKEDVSVSEVRARLIDPHEYWGGTNGPATPTRVIKQADVATLLVLFPDLFSDRIKQKNFAFYEKYTEHGSSLSAAMYSLLACQIKQPDWAYPFFLKSASIDLGTDAKTYAGTIYIGGTHPASNAGAYMSAVYGFAGLRYTDKGIRFRPCLPRKIKSLTFRYYEFGILKETHIDHRHVSARKAKP